MQIKTLIFAFIALPCIASAADDPAVQHKGNNVKTVNHAFAPGERLNYAISWSRIFNAGVASMEVRQEQTPEGKKTLRIVSTARSTGLAGKLYRVRDTIQSVMDADEMFTLEYDVDQKHGKRHRLRNIVFNQLEGTARMTLDGREEINDIPARVQDPLSSLYYMRTLSDLTPGTSIVIDTHEKGKNWSVEVNVLGKESVSTPMGDFNTIKIKTYPTFEGVFMHKGEIFVWLTDDERRIPVMMKSTISVGSIVAVLTDMTTGEQTK